MPVPCMTPPHYDELAEQVRMMNRWVEEVLPKFNWGASALDANAISLLNEGSIKARDITRRLNVNQEDL